jgi:virginiamycin B lyase
MIRHAYFAAGVLALAALQTMPMPVRAQSMSSTALSGSVHSAREAVMEGVLVTAKKKGSTISTTVVTDDKGHYQFPQGRLDAGTYNLSIRAIGYDLDGPAQVEISAQGAAHADLNLRPTAHFEEQLTTAEWIASLSGTDDQKKFLYNCGTCHTVERIVQSNHSSDEFLQQTMVRMAGYASMASPLSPQTRVAARSLERNFGPEARNMANFLASVNLSAHDKHNFDLKTLPRPKGRATHVIITQYDLPREETQPHDVVGDKEGVVWFTQFGEMNLGKMDQKTGKVQEFPIPVHLPEQPKGTLDLESDMDGNFWISMMNQTGAATFDKKTQTFKSWPVPKDMTTNDTQESMVGAQHWEVDGKVWINDTDKLRITRLDVATGKMEPWISPYQDRPKGEPHSIYGLYTDPQNNLYFLDFSGENVGRVDAKTREVQLYPTPTRRSRPRRGRLDDQGHLWFAEWRANKIGMFDTTTKEFKEWTVPTEHMAPYDVAIDQKGELWSGGMNTDRFLRMNVSTGETVEYLMPRETNTRRVFVDTSAKLPVLWSGNNHAASILKVEPLD